MQLSDTRERECDRKCFGRDASKGVAGDLLEIDATSPKRVDVYTSIRQQLPEFLWEIVSCSAVVDRRRVIAAISAASIAARSGSNAGPTASPISSVAAALEYDLPPSSPQAAAGDPRHVGLHEAPRVVLH